MSAASCVLMGLPDALASSSFPFHTYRAPREGCTRGRGSNRGLQSPLEANGAQGTGQKGVERVAGCTAPGRCVRFR